MYKKGNATLRINLSALSEEEKDSHYDFCYDPVDHVNVEDDAKYMAALPHSCDQWVIGGLAQIDQLIADLQEIRKELVPR